MLVRRQERAFERIYRRHVGDVYRYALVVLRNPEDAEDVTQTTFLNAYRAFQRGERPRKPINWLMTIAHNVCRQRFRQAARRPSEVAFDEGAIEAFFADESAEPTAGDIRRAIGQLAFNQRAALVMRELEGRSYAEIAEIFGISVGAVETLIFRARQALREQLEGSLTCHEAELAVSRQLDDRLSRAEKGLLRAHLRACADCARFARSQRAQRSALRGLALVPLPQSLQAFSFLGGGAAGAAGAGVAAKAAAFSATALLAGSVASTGGIPQPDRLFDQSAEPATKVSVAAPAGPDALRASNGVEGPRRVARPTRTANVVRAKPKAARPPVAHVTSLARRELSRGQAKRLAKQKPPPPGLVKPKLPPPGLARPKPAPPGLSRPAKERKPRPQPARVPQPRRAAPATSAATRARPADEKPPRDPPPREREKEDKEPPPPPPLPPPPPPQP